MHKHTNLGSLEEIKLSGICKQMVLDLSQFWNDLNDF